MAQFVPHSIQNPPQAAQTRGFSSKIPFERRNSLLQGLEGRDKGASSDNRETKTPQKTAEAEQFYWQGRAAEIWAQLRQNTTICMQPPTLIIIVVVVMRENFIWNSFQWAPVQLLRGVTMVVVYTLGLFLIANVLCGKLSRLYNLVQILLFM